MFGVDHLLELRANFIGQAFAPPGLHHRAIITAAALQIDQRLRIAGPLLLQRLQTQQAVGLHRVVGGQLEQGVEGHGNPRLGGFVRVEEVLVATEQETAHPGLQVHGQLDRFIGVIDHPVGVFHPLDRRQQIGDQRNEEHRADKAQPQRQADVAAQEFTKSLLINRGRRGHGAGLVELSECKEFAPKLAHGSIFLTCFRAETYIPLRPR
ncbi:hypothetical protein D9M71_214030 [compost metagenome]